MKIISSTQANRLLKEVTRVLIDNTTNLNVFQKEIIKCLLEIKYHKNM